MIDDSVPTGRELNTVTTKRLAALVGRSHALTGVIAADGTPIYLSPSAVEVHTGRPSSELSVETGSDLIHPDDFEALAHSFGVSRDRPGEPVPVHYRTLHTDGSWRIIEGTYTNLLDDPTSPASCSTSTTSPTGRTRKTRCAPTRRATGG